MKKILSRVKVIVFAVVCVTFFIIFLCLCGKNQKVNAANDVVALKIWQIDSFEGGKGSRAEYLQTVGREFGKKENCYVSVVSLSGEAARLNLSSGNIPDLISYGAGIHGLENYIKGFNSWCRGGYCLLTLDTTSDFSDVSGENTVINRGKDNLSGVAALFCGLQGGKVESPTSAYVKLIGGEYKYLLGTQRDIFRLQTRQVAFSVKPVTQFNDLYQNISVIKDSKNSTFAQKYIEFLLNTRDKLNKIGMLSDGINLYGDSELKAMENISFDYKITYPINSDMKDKIEKSVLSGDINILKKLLK